MTFFGIFIVTLGIGWLERPQRTIGQHEGFELRKHPSDATDFAPLGNVVTGKVHLPDTGMRIGTKRWHFG
uniref:Putative secreted peptide n=1 Tax=Anopheles braziliensis TaxID=58242 RepID=A0A2M3ZP03_9DIPT